MRFVDEATIQVRAGKGGHGCVSFRREKFVPRGGPDGGDGGKGGSVILKADSRLLSLYDFRLKRQYEARNGQPGMGSQCNGRKGDDLILGLPNAGKSTFISQVSAARPKIAAYPFTTLTPNLGVMIDEYDPDRRMVIADIPGLIEGAHEGQGLGHRFLKHVERTRFLVHILSIEDVSDDNPWAGFELINEELRRFDPELAERRQIEVVNKIDLVDEERLEELRARARADGREVFFISARDGIGIEDLVAALWKLRDEVQVHEPLHHFVEAENVDEEEFEDIEVIYTRE